MKRQRVAGRAEDRIRALVHDCTDTELRTIEDLPHLERKTWSKCCSRAPLLSSAKHGEKNCEITRSPCTRSVSPVGR